MLYTDSRFTNPEYGLYRRPIQRPPLHAGQEYQPSETQLYTHGYPHTPQPQDRSQQCGQCEPHRPDAHQIHRGGYKAYLRPQQKHRRRQWPPQNIGSAKASMRNTETASETTSASGVMIPIMTRSRQVHDCPHHRHDGHTHNDRNAGKPTGQVETTGPEALPYQCRSGIGYSVSRHITKASRP